ncbi:MAG: type II toxin-antitoxin system PemK/MazF family toxin [Acidobacteriota bacterium]
MKVSQWSVWLANLDPVVGSEQGKTRPVLIISDTDLNNILPVVNVLPITGCCTVPIWNRLMIKY